MSAMRRQSSPLESGEISPTNSSLYVAQIVIAYWSVSISMVYLNKFLLSSDEASIPAPLFLTWSQCFITCIICFIIGEIGGDSKTSDGWFSTFPKARYQLAQAKEIAPLSLIFVGMITFNQLCLKYVEVSFYNVARSLTIVFNVLLGYLYLGTSTSLKTKLCLAVVIVGFFVGTKGEINFSLAGTTSGILSSLFVSMNAIFTKKVLPAVGNDQWRLTFVNNANASIIFLPLIWLFERDVLQEKSAHFGMLIFWASMLLAGVFGFLIGIVTVMQIRATSPLSHNISGTAKAAFQSILAFWIWGNTPTVEGIMGIVLVLGGSGMYTSVKLREVEAARIASKVEIEQKSLLPKVAVKSPNRSSVL